MRRKSVADECIREGRERIAALAPAERLALALALGRRDLEAYGRASGLSLDEARRAIERRRQKRRRSSGAMEAVIA